MSPDPYDELAQAPPEARVGLLLRRIEADAEGHLHLPARDGKPLPLEGIDLSGDALRARFDASSPPRWWDAERNGIDLRHADLRGASLRGANLAGALLEGADLSGADLAGADLRGAVLDGANFAGAFVED